MAKKIEITDKNGRDKIGMSLYFLYLIFLIAAFVVAGKIIYIQLFYKPSPALASRVLPSDRKKTLAPERGSIYAMDGRLLAMSVPMYQIYMDCTVQKDAFGMMKDGTDLENKWREEARDLSNGLSSIYQDKSGTEYFNTIISGREKGKKYLKIGSVINHETLQLVKDLPLFKEGANKGGIIIEKFDTRQYPYSSLARRVIGYVKNNSAGQSNGIGIEDSFDKELHGTEGYEWLRLADGKRFIHNFDSSSVKAVDGCDIRTTIDIDLQDIADRSLRSHIADDPKLEGGCVILMDVKSGAIRAMVNLSRDSLSGRLTEVYNFAIGRKNEPGSVFKTAILMGLLDDGKVELSTEIPTNHGFIKGFRPDDHITDYERKEKTDKISVLHGFEISSNYVFRYLAIENYKDNPKRLLNKLYNYKLGESFDFDLVGLQSPTLPTDDISKWSRTDLGSVGIGYTVSETPLHILTFYNAIANKGRMMKPYLVESIERDGHIVEKGGSKVLNSSICSKATADTLTRALRRVVTDGTARTRLRGAKCEIAGKTGTARRILEPKHTKISKNPYMDERGRMKYQATFVGFYPADEPKYTAICVVYSKLDREVYFGGTVPAMTIRDIVDKSFASDKGNGEILSKKHPLPKWEKEEVK